MWIIVTLHSTHNIPKNRLTLDLIALSLAVVIYTLSLDFRSLDNRPFMEKTLPTLFGTVMAKIGYH